MMIRTLYTLLLTLAAPILLWGLYRTKPGKPAFGSRWKEHFGCTPPLLATGQPIWIHAASVGEAIAIVPVIKALKQAYPEQAIIVTTTTSTGAEQVAKLGELVEHRYMPIDFGWCVRGFIKSIKPKLFLIVEKELWLNTLTCIHHQKIPTVIVNARLSERSAKRYQSFSFFTHQLLNKIDKILCLHNDDAQRFIDIGAQQHQIAVTGSIKYDITIADTVFEQAHHLRKQLGIERPIFVAASTHQGEDEQVLDAYQAVLQQYPDAMVIIVPRHPQRFDSVAKLAIERGLTVHRRTTSSPIKANTQLYLADTMGEMLVMLATADVTFMGGSLVGEKVGGHNLLEPAAVVKPAITGPSFYNFEDITQQLLAAGAIEICQNSHQLAQQLVTLFNDPEHQQYMGAQGQKIVIENQGAVNKTIANIHCYLAND
ncbi:lipid IV(A) 3-deoxy-D-manno-octulosonic acid transferase [Photobacterium phosphoreum]|uniref:lipid IV(A) 3-deoxy-D-manno-octulosonic acid transferase n=1 Tax=Photobacterium phosphoreum TaxID=659 RepID=UPI0005D2D759|nr:lipid IV(A) 3-deoxy-D-manno-octulosonic acid transferase [Photobacterium phosphoreum]KJF85123.1 3-deoxy-D-manno-octulosonic acid transferase [Photobacterium phosphoreum]PQJ92270.1 3-deoxy-D-manno-octulosonic acid transferase [Photobacterium phosphoreum]PSV67410.1 3-deoxy-D-manno-octulosonic acid transferase [Photobacterium phosphoreum]